MLRIDEIKVGQSYACKFKCETMLDINESPITDDSIPLKGPGIYQSLGIIKTRDIDQQVVKLIDEKTKKTFVIPFSDIWDIDEIEWVEET